MSKLNDEEFAGVVEAAPLVSLDLIVRNHEGNILLGYRNNRPAQSFWFVPGGRVRKNERLDDAFTRLTNIELKLDISRQQAAFLGPYEHLYSDNFMGREGSGTHYVVLAYELQLAPDQQCSLDDQHARQRWWSAAELLAEDRVHPNTKAYFDERFIL